MKFVIKSDKLGTITWDVSPDFQKHIEKLLNKVDQMAGEEVTKAVQSLIQDQFERNISTVLSLIAAGLHTGMHVVVWNLIDQYLLAMATHIQKIIPAAAGSNNPKGKGKRKEDE